MWSLILMRKLDIKQINIKYRQSSYRQCQCYDQKNKGGQEDNYGPFIVNQVVREDISEEVTLAETWMIGELKTINDLTFPSGWNQNFMLLGRPFEICPLINSLASSLSLVNIDQRLLKNISK